MAASISDKITKTFSSVNPNVARVTATRTAGGSSLSCDNLAGWPTDTAVHFSTYQIDTSNAVVSGTQIDWKGIVSGDTIGSLTRVAGATDSGSSVGDVVEMNPTASWANDLATALTAEHNQDGTHGDVTADSVTTDTLVVNTGTTLPAGDIGTADIADGAVTPAKTSGALAFSAYRSTAQSVGTGSVVVQLDAEDVDTHNAFDTSTNKFTVPTGYAGVYHIEGTVSWTASGAQRLNARLYKNGSVVKVGGSSGDTSGSTSANVCATLSLAEGDYIQLVSSLSAAGRTILAGADSTYMSGHLVGKL